MKTFLKFLAVFFAISFVLQIAVNGNISPPLAVVGIVCGFFGWREKKDNSNKADIV